MKLDWRKRLSISLVPTLWGTTSQWVKTDRWIECRSIPVLSSFTTEGINLNPPSLMVFLWRDHLHRKLSSYISRSLICQPCPYFLSARIHQRCVRRFRELVQFVAENDRDLNSQTDLRQDIFQSDEVLSSHGEKTTPLEMIVREWWEASLGEIQFKGLWAQPGVWNREVIIRWN